MKKILLVDDSNTVLLMHRMLFAGKPYELLFAKNGKEALSRASADRPDLIFMDVIMPEMGGFEACRKLREMPETKRTPIVLVTTRGEPQNVEAGFAAGCTAYITKPFNGPELIGKVREFLGE